MVTKMITPTKEIMEQHKEMELEIEKIREEAENTEKSIVKLLEEGTVRDKVTGGLGGLQGFHIEGFPEKEYNRRRTILRNKKNRLVEKENDLMELVTGIELFIDNIPVSRDRLVFRGIYLEKKTQESVARELHIDRSLVSKIISKYL